MRSKLVGRGAWPGSKSESAVADVPGSCFRLIGMTRGDSHLGARIGEDLRDALADTFAAAGDQDRSALE